MLLRSTATFQSVYMCVCWWCIFQCLMCTGDAEVLSYLLYYNWTGVYSWICEKGKERTHFTHTWKDRESFKLYPSPLAYPTTTTTFPSSLKLSHPIKSLSPTFALWFIFFFLDFPCLHDSNITSLSLSHLFFPLYATPLLSLPPLCHLPCFSLCLFLPHINPLVINLPLSLLVAPHFISHISTSYYLFFSPHFSSVFFTLYLVPPADCIYGVFPHLVFSPTSLSHLSVYPSI